MSGEIFEPEPAPQSREIDIEAGRELAVDTREMISDAAAAIAELPLGERTGEAFQQFVDSLQTRPDAVRIFAAHEYDARFVHDAITHGEITHTEDRTIRPESFVMEVTQAGVEKFQGETIALLAVLGVDLSQAEAHRLALLHITAHELGHGIENAYKYVMPSIPPHPSVAELWPTPTYERFDQKIIESGVVEAYRLPASPVSEPRIASERFAEGLAHYVLENELVRSGYITVDQIPEAAQVLKQQRQNPSYEAALEAVAAVPAGEGNSNALLQQLELRKVSLNHLGYGQPNTRLDIEAILQLTP